jgi:replication factor A1
MKAYKEGMQFLSGTSACHWYINENDIPEVKAFQSRYITNSNYATKISSHAYKKFLIQILLC